MRANVFAINAARVLAGSFENKFATCPVRLNYNSRNKHHKTKMPVPDRWLDYTAIGSVIPNSNFIAFKVPLHQHICQRLPSPERHTTQNVVDIIPRLGIVINLTATQTDSKYYQPRDWENFGVEYKWLRTEGRVTPSQSTLIQFCRTVKKFLTENPEKLVGVHCTHGLNRTGYFVCSYLVLCNNLSPSEALKNFADARGHSIERPNYIASIMQHHSNDRLRKTLESADVDDDCALSRRQSSTADLRLHATTRRSQPRYDNFQVETRGRNHVFGNHGSREIHSYTQGNREQTQNHHWRATQPYNNQGSRSSRVHPYNNHRERSQNGSSRTQFYENHGNRESRRPRDQVNNQRNWEPNQNNRSRWDTYSRDRNNSQGLKSWETTRRRNRDLSHH